ncbi:hypothetical protein CKO28_01115 [Rhodovibrio sodomensis]|uniref:Uncharacterized protein n=1 Tax=Rhodovibrio sodomensis TaxID=1088 RepID=A0ABS1D891_9PROT|nr:hypothetical protein [Rhodovibrio sodomensis]MBK1666643.1 hypothetical protein [Rhodovibrio sodomensis]
MAGVDERYARGLARRVLEETRRDAETASAAWAAFARQIVARGRKGRRNRPLDFNPALSALRRAMTQIPTVTEVVSQEMTADDPGQLRVRMLVAGDYPLDARPEYGIMNYEVDVTARRLLMRSWVSPVLMSSHLVERLIMRMVGEGARPEMLVGPLEDATILAMLWMRTMATGMVPRTLNASVPMLGGAAAGYLSGIYQPKPGIERLVQDRRRLYHDRLTDPGYQPVLRLRTFIDHDSLFPAQDEVIGAQLELITLIREKMMARSALALGYPIGLDEVTGEDLDVYRHAAAGYAHIAAQTGLHRKFSQPKRARTEGLPGFVTKVIDRCDPTNNSWARERIWPSAFGSLSPEGESLWERVAATMEDKPRLPIGSVLA